MKKGKRLTGRLLKHGQKGDVIRGWCGRFLGVTTVRGGGKKGGGFFLPFGRNQGSKMWVKGSSTYIKDEDFRNEKIVNGPFMNSHGGIAHSSMVGKDTKKKKKNLNLVSWESERSGKVGVEKRSQRSGRARPGGTPGGPSKKPQCT